MIPRAELDRKCNFHCCIIHSFFWFVSFVLRTTSGSHARTALARRNKPQRLQNARELQDILTAVLQSDTNGDYTLGTEEMEILLLRLSSFSAADETKLRRVLQNRRNESVSTTTLYNDLVTSGSFVPNDEGEFDYTFGTSQWLFDEDA